MAIRIILQLGNSDLYRKCNKVFDKDIDTVMSLVDDLRDTLQAFRQSHGFGRAIAAPQIGEFSRVIYLEVEEPLVIINPTLSGLSEEMVELWDDCLSFPDLLVKVERHCRCRLSYIDLDSREHTVMLDNAMAELVQHEYDHLEGILAVERAIDGRSFSLRS